MAQKYIIYINQTTLIISEFIPKRAQKLQQIDSQSFDFNTFYNRVKADPLPVLYFVHTAHAKDFLKRIKSAVNFIKAAGGLVSNEENKFLFIYRKDKWDLPKGKLDDFERIKTCAVREVEEETGIKVKKLGDKICNTYHIYNGNGGKPYLKKTSWFKMKAENQSKLKPQIEENITEARWLAISEFNLVKENTYPLILDVLSFVESD
ncbi:MAG TPA: NUDIX domain-containing protein [Sphingobacteriaceae bacterium]|nr:NUDIX domain-containing protein [Sphingobacteriaceae bacterium]